MTSSHSTAAVLMIRPRHFAGNVETADSNRFQAAARAGVDLREAARAEFDSLARALANAGVDVHVVEGQCARIVPDEVFPNNWISFHDDGTVVLYPMMAPSRRLERRHDVIDLLRRQLGYGVRRVVDLTDHERDGRFLEGTGSLVLDRRRRVAYACLSPRTTAGALDAFSERLRYEIAAFEAVDEAGHPIYHTNVLMSLGTDFAAICSAAIADPAARAGVLQRLAAGGRQIVDLSRAQMRAFAGNILELRGHRGPVIALSTTALDALDPWQRQALRRYGDLVCADVGMIETYGGGSVRCMLAEVHLPRAATAGEQPSVRG